MACAQNNLRSHLRHLIEDKRHEATAIVHAHALDEYASFKTGRRKFGLPYDFTLRVEWFQLFAERDGEFELSAIF